ncbi:uncharacterized protein LOC126881087 [Diabrotica virgifera virgifera]|uniref:THAP-type domain-containing protein n=1 Tax=Diabrotica virgifera virgifera TaxID=50390 RepID=A0ABM5JT19_DIAVI|nr:uncharacterized protein LOC126881087 [Diabrotica virgifera virgifera]
MEEDVPDEAGRGTIKRARTAKSECEVDPKEQVAALQEVIKTLRASFQKAEDKMAKKDEENERLRAEISQQSEKIKKMSSRCAVYGCAVDNMCKSFVPGTAFYSFPKDKEMQAVWKHLCKRKDSFNVKFARVCSKHFIESDYERNLKHELLGYTPAKHRPLKKDAAPSINLPTATNKQKQKANSADRTNRQHKRQQKRLVDDLLNR